MESFVNEFFSFFQCCRNFEMCTVRFLAFKRIYLNLLIFCDLMPTLVRWIRKLVVYSASCDNKKSQKFLTLVIISKNADAKKAF